MIEMIDPILRIENLYNEMEDFLQELKAIEEDTGASRQRETQEN